MAATDCDLDGFRAGQVVLSDDTEEYFRACRSLVVSNEDVEFKDTTDHSSELVLAVIQSYENVFLKPMLARGSK